MTNRILVVNQSVQYGGGEVYLLQILEALLKRGCAVTVLNCNANVPDKLRLDLENLPLKVIYATFSVWRPESFLVNWRFYKLLGENDYDLVFFNRTGGWAKYSDLIPAARLKRKTRLAAVEHYHPPAFPIRVRQPFRTIRNLLYCRLQARCLDAIICVNRAAKLQFSNPRYGYPGSRVHVIHNGVDTSRFRFDPALRDSVRDSLGLGDKLLVLFCGRLSEEKGADVLVQAWAALSDDDRDSMQLLIIGDGGMLDELREQASQHGIASSVVFAGFQPDVLGYLCACDIFVMPSREESFGISLAEAMAVGRYAIATRVGGMPELMSRDNLGQLIDRDAPDQLTAAIRVAAADPALRKAVGEQAQLHVRENFSSEAMQTRTADVLLGLLQD